jgi:site-specific DNA-methyltransferase (cytosine-N4-specific)
MSIHYSDDQVTLHLGDALDVLRTLPDSSADSCVTSPPYFGLRDYGEAGQYGLESSPAEYVDNLRTLFAEVRRVLAADGTLWLNLGDSYYSGRGNPGPNAADGKQPARRGWTRVLDQPGQDWAKPKDLLMVPELVALALRGDGWILRNKIIWDKPNAMPESVADRLSCRYEQVFLFVKSRRYWFDLDPIREPLIHPDAADGSRVFGGKQAGLGKVGSSYRTAGGMPNTYGRKRDNTWSNGTPMTVGDAPSVTAAAIPETTDSGTQGRNPGDVWTISTKPFAEAHFAVMPPELAERCILAGCRPGGTVLDPFSGSGTTGMVAQRHGRKYVGIDLNADYLDMSLRTRLQQAALDFTETA